MGDTIASSNRVKRGDCKCSFHAIIARTAMLASKAVITDEISSVNGVLTSSIE